MSAITSASDFAHQIGHPPRPLTSFIGREREVALVVDQLHRDDVRLLTMIGPGGVGKTRLAIQVAQAMANDFPDAIWFVPLASVRDPALVASTVARTLGAEEIPSRSIVDGIVAILAGRQSLLILDNFEHVLEAGPLITDLLHGCPALHVMVTSRAVLRLSGEHAIVVPPLSLPTSNDGEMSRRRGTQALLESSEAIRLFVARASAANAAFALTDGTAADVAVLCTQLDGLPLAIELAAARTRSLPPEAMVRRLEQRLPLLTDGPRDQPPRLRSMHDAIAWSYGLLGPEEQTLFRQLAVFVGGCTLEAAEAVCAEGSSRAIRALDGITSLIDKSLLRQERGSNGEPRYLMLETVREFALEQLTSSGEEATTRDRHVAFFLHLAEEADPRLIVPGQEVWLARLEADHDNYRAALAWLEASGEVEIILRLTGALRNLWLLHSHYVEGRQRLEQALAAAPAARPAWRARALAGASQMAMYQGDQEAARRHRSESMMLWHELGDAPEVARLRLGIGASALLEGDFEGAAVETEAALIALQTLDDAVLVARPLASMALSNLGDIARRQGNPRRALALCTEALVLQRQLGYTWGMIISLVRIGDAAQQIGDVRRAAAAYRECLEMSRALWDHRIIAWALFGLARLAAATAPKSAVRLMSAVDHWSRTTGVTLQVMSHREEHRTAELLARAELGDDGFAAAWANGSLLSPAQTIDEAIGTAAAILASAADDESLTRARGAGLTPREVDVLRLLVIGNSNAEIGYALSISPRTVTTHLTRIFTKLGVSSRTGAIAAARGRNLV